MELHTGPQLAVQVRQLDGPNDDAVILVWPARAEIHISTSASDGVRRWVDAWICAHPTWFITDARMDSAGLVEVLTLRAPM